MPVLLAVGCLLAVCTAAAPFTVDDAFIIARYARRLADGQGYTFDGSTPSDGVTGPLWLLPMLLAEAVGAPPTRLADVVGACAAAGAAALAVLAAHRLAGMRAAWSAAALLCVQVVFGIWAVGGLETAAASFAVTALAWACLWPHAIIAGSAAAAVAWLRPELVAAAGVLLAGLWVRDRGRGLRATGIAVAGGLALLAFRLWMFQHVLPLSFHAKGGSLANGLEYVVIGTLVLTGGGGIVLAALAIRSGVRGAPMLMAAVCIHVLAVALAGGDWMPGPRLLMPVVPVYAVLAGTGVAATSWRSRAARAGLLLAMSLALGLPLLDGVVQLPRARESGALRQQAAAPLAKWLSDHIERVALVDVGYLGYASGVGVIDLAGLTDPAIARMPGGHLDKRVDVGYLSSRRPDALLVHATRAPCVTSDDRLCSLPGGFPVERRVALDAWARRRFRVARIVRYRPGYLYVVLVRD